MTPVMAVTRKTNSDRRYCTVGAVGHDSGHHPLRPPQSTGEDCRGMGAGGAPLRNIDLLVPERGRDLYVLRGSRHIRSSVGQRRAGLYSVLLGVTQRGTRLLADAEDLVGGSSPRIAHPSRFF